MPRSNQDYWAPKFSRNVERDREHLSKLAAAGWEALVVWECEISEASVIERLREFLGPPRM